MKKAFTMLELIFVIIVIGILAAIMIPQMKSDKVREAAIQLVSHIRYTQHLAMVDDRYGDNSTLAVTDWYKSRWQLIFGKSNSGTKHTNNQYTYTIFSDSFATRTGQPDFTNIDTTEIAIDPLNLNKVLSGGYSGTLHHDNIHANNKLNLGRSYGITNMNMTGGCSNQRLSFDHLGRPFEGDSSTLTSAYILNRLITQRCDIVLTGANGSVTISIEPETGYAHIIDS